MPEGCPSNALLDAFAQGEGAPAERERIATHVSTCGHCASRIGQVVAKVSLHGPTQYDSPGAGRRRISHQSLPEVVDDDTHISGEKKAAREPLGKGSTLSRYVVLERLAEGGMGEVYAAYDPDLDRKVALKLLKSDFAGSDTAGELRMRMLREAQAMAKLSHPNVVTVHDVGLIDDQVFIAMEFVEGVTAADWLGAKNRTWPQVLEMYIQAGRGLAAAHAAGITHRDFKPENVVVSKNGRVRVIDFGLAHALAPQPQTDSNPPPELSISSESSGHMKRKITQPGTVLGTPAYMAPEQLLGQATDHRSDQFSFCVALYEALYGERPFDGLTAPALMAEIQWNRVRSAPQGTLVPARIRKLLLRGLRASPGERFRSLNALLVGLERRRTAVVRQWIGAAAVLVVTLVGVAFWVQHSRAQAKCAEAADRFRGLWDEPAREQARSAFLATGMPWSKKAYEGASRALDAYTARWSLMRRAACEEQTAGDERLGQTLLCLSRAHSEAAAVARLFTRADHDVVERATATVLGLPPLDACTSQALTPAAIVESDANQLALAEARALLDAGKYEQARKALLPLLAGSPRAALLDAIALSRLGELAPADARLEEAILAAEAARADETLARAWTERVGVAALMRQPADAERWSRFARAALDRARGGAELEAGYLNNVGVLAWARGDSDAAIDAHTRALVLRRRVLGPDHPVLARSLSNLGIALRAAGRLPEAIERYREAQALEERVLDASHPAVAETLNNLGNALAASGDRAAAIEAVKRSLDIKERAFGADSLAAAVGLTNLGVLLLQDGQLEEAGQRLRRSLEIKEKRSPETLSTALTLSNLAVLEEKRARHAEALTAAEAALKIRRAKLGADHADLGNDLLTQGQALLGLGRKKEAAGVLEQIATLKGVEAGLVDESRALRPR
ncbi:MAG: tetratricopeptide repeat protein [Myxococcaceae bacterium]|nr:tetratricopeptide repeat protein [Myxococcaceae bacterium]